MEALTRTHPDVAFVFLYVREAHPGERVGAHRTFADKLRSAEMLRQRWHVERSILVDDLSGTLHQAYGLLPNMAYVVDRRGRVTYRADWTDAKAIEMALRYLSGETNARAGGERVAPFYSEILGHRTTSNYPRVFLEGLWAAGGERAVQEFIAATERQSPALAGRMRREWTGLQKTSAKSSG